MLRNAVGGGSVSNFQKKCYECVQFNIIRVMKGWVDVKFEGKKAFRNILEWPL